MDKVEVLKYKKDTEGMSLDEVKEYLIEEGFDIYGGEVDNIIERINQIKMKENSIMVPMYVIELLYGTMVNIDIGILDKEQVRECLEILNKFHDKIEEEIGK